MKNTILDHMYKVRNGHYCHAIEVYDVPMLEGIIEGIIEEFSEDYNGIFKNVDVIEFINSLSIYALECDELTEAENSANEDEIYDFDCMAYIDGTL